jgi:hypothetical protein
MRVRHAVHQLFNWGIGFPEVDYLNLHATMWTEMSFVFLDCHAY